LFRLLGLHPTTRFSTQAATAIAGLSPEVTHQALDALIGAHLIQQERAERYYLHDVLHAYAADLSRADERTRTVRRMVDWYLRSLSNARELMTPDKHPVPALVSEENIKPLVFKTGQEAVQWCTTERHTLLSVTRLAWSLGLNGHVWRFAAGLGELLDRYGDLHEKVTVQSLGWEAAVQAGDRRAEAGCLNNLGRAFIRLHNYDRAEKCFEVALSLFHEAGDRYGAAVSLHNQATVRLERGDARQAINIFEQGLVYFAEAGPEWSEAHVHHRLGDCYRSLDDYDQADRCYQLALALRARIGDLRGQGTTLTSLGQLHLEQGKVEAAITYCEASIDIHRQTLDQGNMAEALCVLASAVMGRSAKQAIEYAQNATALYQALGAPQEQAHALTILATAFETAGELDSAHATWTDICRTFAILGDPRAAEAERRVHDLRGAVSAIPDPRLDQAEIGSMKEKT
jgi:tetratricopeptide (TPR) repeat protein